MSGEHAPLQPSAAPQWAFCTGSVAVNRAAPDLETDASREGEAAHWVGAECLQQAHWIGNVAACAAWLGATAPNGVVIDEKMAEGAQVWVDDVLGVWAGEPLLIEHRVHMPQIHPDNWGRLDTAFYDKYTDTLYLWDYKHGHRENSARENFQLVDYVAGLSNELPITHNTKVVMRIVQPFCYKADGPVNEWGVLLKDLAPYFVQLSTQAREAVESPTLTAGTHCRDCPAIGRCGTAKRSGYSVIQYAKEPYAIDKLDGAELAIERAILREGLIIAKARLEAIEDDLHARISGGETGTGLALQAKFGRVTWNVDTKQAVSLAKQFGVDADKPGVLTPAQTKAKVPVRMRPAFEKALKLVTKRPSNGVTLINADDSTTARAFKPTEK